MRDNMGKYRGKLKCENNSDWVYGFLHADHLIKEADDGGLFVVDPDTVGQLVSGEHYEGNLYEQASGIQELIWDEQFCKFCLINVESDEYGMRAIQPFSPSILELNLIGNVHTDRKESQSAGLEIRADQGDGG